MIIIIDGYNVLKQVFYKVKGKLDKQRMQFIKQLGHYKSKKSKEIKDIIVVFDGGHLRHATREVRCGVVVVFSGQIDSADDWIIKWVKKHKNEELLLVSLDGQLVASCKPYGVDSIKSMDFYSLVQDSILQDLQAGAKKMQQNNVQKYDDFDIYDYDSSDIAHRTTFGDVDRSVNQQALDLLMEQSSLSQYKKEDNYDAQDRKKRKSHKISKKEKKVYRKIKKL